MPSPFFSPGDTAAPGNVALLHLKRDLITAFTLQDTTDDVPEKIENTRFGAYPHSTLAHQPWGSQILASKVDTGSRGRAKGGKKLKRKRENGDEEKDQDDDRIDDIGFLNLGVTASSGFAHLLPPTPETWTIGLPHRTQVVYTPDYSYILHRLRARPGDRIIEAGAGSGSFTHAAARAVYNGYAVQKGCVDEDAVVTEGPDLAKYAKKRRKIHGKVYSFEFHEPRFQSLQQEIIKHGLEGVVRVTHRDVYNDGFCVSSDNFTEIEEQEPRANAIFLDLPAPWLALPHLTRQSKSGTCALDPLTSVRICTFSPCIEQVTKTVSTLRELGWVDIDMAELQHKRIDIIREKVGLGYEGLRGVNPTPANVEEAIKRLKEVEGRNSQWAAEMKEKQEEGDLTPGKPTGEKGTRGKAKQQRLDAIKRAAETGDMKLYKEGKLIHRTEPEIKTHTSYLVFAVLPRIWTEEDEKRAREKFEKQKPKSNGSEATNRVEASPILENTKIGKLAQQVDL